MKNIFIIATSIFLFTACQDNKGQQSESSSKGTEQSERLTEDYTLIGKKGLLVYPEFKAEVSYLSDSTLYWRTTMPNGQVNEGHENMFFKKLNNYQYFLNWIEQDGFTISQIIDLKAKTVTAFGTFADEKSQRGKRSSMKLEGSFEFVN